MPGRPRTVPQLASTSIRRDALAIMIALLRTDRSVAVLALPAGLAGALAGHRAIPIMLAGLVADWYTAVVAAPAVRAPTGIWRDTCAIIITSSQDLIHAFASNRGPGGLEPVRPRVIIRNSRSIRKVRVLYGHI